MPRGLVAPRNTKARTHHAVRRAEDVPEEAAENEEKEATKEPAHLTRSPRV